jgi:hypothetical protein
MVDSDDGWIVGDSGLFLHASIGGTTVTATFTDDEVSEFNSGTYSDTQFDTDHVELDATGLTNGTGTFTSQIFDSTDAAASWKEITWIPSAPYGKELPDSAATETAYGAGNADMTNNELLLHMNEASGSISDASGNGNDGTETGGVTYGATAILNDGLSFDGVDDIVTVSDDATLDITDDITVEAWTDWVSGTGGGGGIIGEIENAVIDTFEHNTSRGNEPDIIHISGDVYAIAYRGPGNDGFISTVEIDSAGVITGSVIDQLEYDTSQGKQPDIIPISGDIYAIAYRGNGDDGWVATVDIDSAGTIANSVVDSFEFNTSQGVHPAIVNVTGDVYAIAYQGAGSDGFISTVDIDASGTITSPVLDAFEYETTNGRNPDIINIDSNTVAVTYRGDGGDGFVATFDIGGTGSISAIVDTLEFNTTNGDFSSIIKISGDTHAVAYKGPGRDGWLSTFDIDSAGTIGSVIDSFEFNSTEGQFPHITFVASDVYAIAYRGVDSDGFVTTIDIDTSGNIGASTIDTLEFNTGDGREPKILPVSGDVFAIAYGGPGSDGFVTTVDIATTTGAGTGVGISKSGAYELLVDGTTAYAVINSTTVSSATLGSGFNHVAMTYDKDAGSDQIKLYVNGIEASTGTLTDAIVSNANDLIIGDSMEGTFDEVAIFSEVLTPTEVLDHYKRGALDLQFQVRSCDDAVCSGETFIGPDGTGSDYYDELDNSTITLPDFNLTNASNNQYFQYQTTFTTSDSSYSPDLEGVTITYQTVTTGGGSGFSASGTFLSQIFNSDSASTSWETLYWTETLPASTNATIAVRSGNTATPDGSWSSFSSEFTSPDGIDILSQTGQYFQYRVSLATSDSGSTPLLEDITVTYK